MSESIGKLKDGAISLTRVAQASSKAAAARGRVALALDERRAAILAAEDDGASLVEIAEAAKLTTVRVQQILRGRK